MPDPSLRRPSQPQNGDPVRSDFNEVATSLKALTPEGRGRMRPALLAAALATLLAFPCAAALPGDVHAAPLPVEAEPDPVWLLLQVAAMAEEYARGFDPEDNLTVLWEKSQALLIQVGHTVGLSSLICVEFRIADEYEWELRVRNGLPDWAMVTVLGAGFDDRLVFGLGIYTFKFNDQPTTAVCTPILGFQGNGVVETA